ncbi:MAG: hypothetical protein IPK84_04245 [Candidatus Moraniibacteriota bacterium]|nr:MAG: hypothetical protein IPK84_04245 [Candidatus Moranbacteria bacterium]
MKFFRTKKSRGDSSTLLRPKRSRLFRAALRKQQRTISQENVRRWSLWAVGYVLLWGAFFGLVIFALFFSSLLRIDQEDIDPLKYVSMDEVNAVIRDELSGKVFGIFPKDTIPVAFLRRHILERKILEVFPVLRSVTVSFAFPEMIILKSEERVPTLMFCSGGPCFLVDERGVAFEGVPNPSAASEPKVLSVIDMSAKPVSQQDPLFSEDFLKVFPVIRQRLLDELGVEVSNIAETPSRLSDELWFRSVDGWKLRMSATVPVEKSMLALRLLFAKTLSEGDLKNLDYIDLRTENRIFYAMKGDEQKEHETTSDDESENESSDASQEKGK